MPSEKVIIIACCVTKIKMIGPTHCFIGALCSQNGAKGMPGSLHLKFDMQPSPL